MASERQPVEQRDFHLLVRWFVGSEIEDPAWDASTCFEDRRHGLIAGSVAAAFLSAVLAIPRIKRLSQGHSA